MTDTGWEPLKPDGLRENKVLLLIHNLEIVNNNLKKSMEAAKKCCEENKNPTSNPGPSTSPATPQPQPNNNPYPAPFDWKNEWHYP